MDSDREQERWLVFRSRERCYAKEIPLNGRPVMKTKDGRIFEVEAFRRRFEPERELVPA